jgi:hypothetical protein
MEPEEFFPNRNTDHTPYGWFFILTVAWILFIVIGSVQLIRLGDRLQTTFRRYPAPGLVDIQKKITKLPDTPISIPTIPSAQELVQQEINKQIETEKAKFFPSPSPTPSGSPSATELTDVQKRLQDLKELRVIVE